METDPALLLRIRKKMNIMGSVTIVLMVSIMALFLSNMISQALFVGLLVLVAVVQSILSVLVILRAKKMLAEESQRGDIP